MKIAHRKYVLTSIIFIVLIGKVQSQQREIDAGMMFFKQADYFNAILQFDKALSYTSGISEANQAKCYYYLAASRIYLYGQTVGDDPTEAVNSGAGDELLKAYDELLLCLSHDDDTYMERIDKQLLNIQPALEQLGLVMVSNLHDTVAVESKEEILPKAKKYLEASLSIRETYLSHDLMGQVLYEEKDFDKAISHFMKSPELYIKDPPEKPDFLVAYTYYRQALIYRYAFDDPDKALSSVQDGAAFLEKLYDEWKINNPGPVTDLTLEGEYRATKKYLQQFELDLYYDLPDRYQEALARFREAMIKEPGNYDLVTGYASLLENSDKEQAIKLYEKAIEIDSTQELAYFNIAALYYSSGKVYYDEAIEEKEEKKYKVLAESATENFLKSIPYFEKVIEINPSMIEAVGALKNISYILDDNQKYLYYQEMEKSIGKQ